MQVDHKFLNSKFWVRSIPVVQVEPQVYTGYLNIAHSVKMRIGNDNQSKKNIKHNIVSIGVGLLNTPTASLQRGDIPTTSVLDMTINNLMVRFQ